VDEALKYLANLVRSKGKDAKVDEEEFKRESGIGIVVTDEEIIRVVDGIFEENKAQIDELGASFDFVKIIYKCRDVLKWADQKKVIDLINKKKADIVGDAKEDPAKKKKAKQVAQPKEEKKEEVKEE
jgi:hypothetical protein